MKFQSILDKFAPPEFIDVSSVGLVFSDTSIRCLYLDPLSKKPIIYKELDLEPGVIQGGQIKNAEKLAKTLEEVRKISPTPFAKFAIPDETSYVFTAKVPVLPGRTAEESVAFVLEENVPIPLGEANFDFLPQTVENGGDGHFAQVVATATSSALVESYATALRRADFEPLLCVNESQAIAKAVIPKWFTGSSIVIYIHKSSIGIYAAKGQTIEFSSTSKVDGKNYSQTIVSELTNTHKYWEEHDGGCRPDIKYFVCGHYEMCSSSLDEINRIECVRAKLANSWVNLFDLEGYIPDISFEDSLKFTSAIGLLI
jgi:Tfp pilus assembly PilM family ATPase